MEGDVWHLMNLHVAEEDNHCLHAPLLHFSLNRISPQKDKLMNPLVYLDHIYHPDKVIYRWDERS